MEEKIENICVWILEECRTKISRKKKQKDWLVLTALRSALLIKTPKHLQTPKPARKKKVHLLQNSFHLQKKKNNRKIISSDLIVLMRATRGACNPIIFRLLLRMRRMYVASIRLDFH